MAAAVTFLRDQPYTSGKKCDGRSIIIKYQEALQFPQELFSKTLRNYSFHEINTNSCI